MGNANLLLLRVTASTPKRIHNTGRGAILCHSPPRPQFQANRGEHVHANRRHCAALRRATRRVLDSSLANNRAARQYAGSSCRGSADCRTDDGSTYRSPAHCCTAKSDPPHGRATYARASNRDAPISSHQTVGTTACSATNDCRATSRTDPSAGRETGGICSCSIRRDSQTLRGPGAGFEGDAQHQGAVWQLTFAK